MKTKPRSSDQWKERERGLQGAQVGALRVRTPEAFHCIIATPVFGLCTYLGSAAGGEIGSRGSNWTERLRTHWAISKRLVCSPPIRPESISSDQACA